jgi:nucleoid-associated protein YgaU
LPIGKAPILPPALAIAPTVTVPPPLLPVASVGPVDPKNETSTAVRATLRDVNPRPLWTNEPGQPLITQPSAAIARSVSDVSDSGGRPETWPPIAQKSGPAGIERPADVGRLQITQSAGPENAQRRMPTVPSPPRESAPPRTHTIVDGDSLQKLAKRYLNDAGRIDEIFAANRGLLTSPDLLPIGAELTIPPAVKATGRGG